MASVHRPILLFLLLIRLSPAPPLAYSLSLGQLGTLLSLSNSLMTRVANLRAARGDLAGATRARSIATNLRIVGGGWGAVWSAGWDFSRNYAWRFGGLRTAEFSSSTGELLAVLAELSRLGSPSERARWVLRQYPRVLSLTKAAIQGLLHAFDRSGPLRDAVLVLQREVVEGELLKDCLEIGVGDVEGLLRIARDLFIMTNSGRGEL